jgi:sugar O-acyltransferase (sialic acid O-acetyltransferase NeuD family)
MPPTLVFAPSLEAPDGHSEQLGPYRRDQMSRPNLILVGAGGHAHACIEVIEQHGKYQIAGLVGLSNEINTLHFGYTVIATDDNLPTLAKEYQYACIALGQIGTPDHRIRLYQRVNALGFQLPTIIATSAYVSRHATLGAGSIVMHGAIVNAGARVGRNCIINTRALIEHDTRVEDHCHISTGAILNGAVKVGTGTFVGSGSSIRDGVSIGKCCVVGIGLTVRHNLPDNTRFIGSY